MSISSRAAGGRRRPVAGSMRTPDSRRFRRPAWPAANEKIKLRGGNDPLLRDQTAARSFQRKTCGRHRATSTGLRGRIETRRGSLRRSSRFAEPGDSSSSCFIRRVFKRCLFSRGRQIAVDVRGLKCGSRAGTSEPSPAAIGRRPGVGLRGARRLVRGDTVIGTAKPGRGLRASLRVREPRGLKLSDGIGRDCLSGPLSCASSHRPQAIGDQARTLASRAGFQFGKRKGLAIIFPPGARFRAGIAERQGDDRRPRVPSFHGMHSLTVAAKGAYTLLRELRETDRRNLGAV